MGIFSRTTGDETLVNQNPGNTSVVRPSKVDNIIIYIFQLLAFSAYLPFAYFILIMSMMAGDSPYTSKGEVMITVIAINGIFFAFAVGVIYALGVIMRRSRAAFILIVALTALYLVLALPFLTELWIRYTS